MVIYVCCQLVQQWKVYNRDTLIRLLQYFVNFTVASGFLVVHAAVLVSLAWWTDSHLTLASSTNLSFLQIKSSSNTHTYATWKIGWRGCVWGRGVPRIRGANYGRYGIKVRRESSEPYYRAGLAKYWWLPLVVQSVWMLVTRQAAGHQWTSRQKKVEETLHKNSCTAKQCD